MPLKRCQTDDKPGWKWGDEGKCYPYTAGNEESEEAARKKALAQAAAMGEFEGTGNRMIDVPSGAEIFERSDALVVSDDVDFKLRTIDVIAVPYEQEAEVPIGGQMWREVFTRSAFNGIENDAGRIPVRREHPLGGTVGKVIKLDPYDTRGLLASVQIAKTPKGDETLQLAAEDMLGASIGYFIKKGSDVDMNRRTMLRRVKRAFIEHLAMTDVPAYANARPVAVREGLSAQPTPGRALVTPGLDEYLSDDVLSWARQRLSDK